MDDERRLVTLGYKVLAPVVCGTAEATLSGLLLERSSKLHADRQQGGDATTSGGVLYVKCMGECCSDRALELHSTGGCIYSGNAFEAHAGRSYRKKWRETIRVLPQNISLKAWLSSVGREVGARDSEPRTKEELVEAALAAVAAAAAAVAADPSEDGASDGGHQSDGYGRHPLAEAAPLGPLMSQLPPPRAQPTLPLASLLGPVLGQRPPALEPPQPQPQQPHPPPPPQQPPSQFLEQERSTGMGLTPAPVQLAAHESPLALVKGMLQSIVEQHGHAAPHLDATTTSLLSPAGDGSATSNGPPAAGSLVHQLIQQLQQAQPQQALGVLPWPSSGPSALGTSEQLPLVQVIASLLGPADKQQPAERQQAQQQQQQQQQQHKHKHAGEETAGLQPGGSTPAVVAAAGLSLSESGWAAAAVGLLQTQQAQADQLRQLLLQVAAQEQRMERQEQLLQQQAAALASFSSAAEQQQRLWQVVSAIRATVDAVVCDQQPDSSPPPPTQQSGEQQQLEATCSDELCSPVGAGSAAAEASAAASGFNMAKLRQLQQLLADPAAHPSLGSAQQHCMHAPALRLGTAAAATGERPAGSSPRGTASTKRPREDSPDGDGDAVTRESL